MKSPRRSPSELLRETPPRKPPRLRSWIEEYTGIKIADSPVCRGHDAPWKFFAELYHQRPPIVLVLGPRGGGKSFLSALHTHLVSRWNPRHETRILGGSRSQSEQVYRALGEIAAMGRSHFGADDEAIAKLLKGGAVYKNGSQVQILAASSTSVRGPHVPSLKLDEVDEIDPDCREAAMGMCMNRHGMSASVLMTSTWHKVNGPMAGLMERSRAGDFPSYKFCAFEVLERCPESRSGHALENCPACPLVKWCHSDRDDHPKGLPKAKRSNGHYGIDSLIQKVRATSVRTFEADYLCHGPRADGLWFPAFDPASHVAARAEYEPLLPVHLALDSGVFTGAVFFQIARGISGGEEVRVFADYLSENVPAEQNARAILDVSRVCCNGRIDSATTDPAGGSRNPVGPTVIGEFERGGLRPLRRWPGGSVADGLALLESFVQPADGRTRLAIHPRCVSLTRGLQNYRRAKRGGQWMDYPEDPQHPHEDLVDALRGGLRACFPEGRRVQPNFARVPARQVF